MRCGLFGKLIAKRDYISVATPRQFLDVWEPWVQSCMSASRHQLGADWQNAFLHAPIWRFWLGAAICGTSVLGAVMPSLDGVGRYFPLTLHAIADAGTSIVQPEIDPQDVWFEAAENFLLSTLDANLAFETATARLNELAAPLLHSGDDDAIISIDGALNAMRCPSGDFAASLASLRIATPATLASASFWWTAGGETFSPMALCCQGLPDPFRFSIMLSDPDVQPKMSSAVLNEQT